MKKILFVFLSLMCSIRPSEDTYQITFKDRIAHQESVITGPKKILDNVFLYLSVFKDEKNTSLINLTKLEVSQKGIETLLKLAMVQESGDITPENDLTNDEALNNMIKQEAAMIDQETLAEMAVIGSELAYVHIEILIDALAQKIAQEGESEKTKSLLEFKSIEFVRQTDLDPLIGEYRKKITLNKTDKQTEYENAFQGLWSSVKNTWNEMTTGLDGN